LCLLPERLERDCFGWPKADAARSLDIEPRHGLLQGIDRDLAQRHRLRACQQVG